MLHSQDNVYWIAFSGGRDSYALLGLCRQLRLTYPLKLRAIHLNHQLHPQAHQWAAHCRQLCHYYAIDYVEECLEIVITAGESLEQVAREKRYACFARLLDKEDYLLTAHHQEDQAETLLLQLMRGAGPKGLAAMPAIKPLGVGWHARPLLHFSRETLVAFAEGYARETLPVERVSDGYWIEDSSNQDEQRSRNFIRQQILPQLKQHWPTVTAAITRSAAHCAEQEVLLSVLSEESYQQALSPYDKRLLSRSAVLHLMPALQRLILRTWIARRGYLMPNTKKMQRIQEDLLPAKPACQACVTWHHVSLRCFRDQLYLLPLSAPMQHLPIITWQLCTSLAIDGIGTLRTQWTLGEGLPCSIHTVVVRFRKGGEKLYISKQSQRKLKKMLQAWAVPYWLRNQLPLIFIEEKLIGVVGYFLSQDYRVNCKEQGQVIVLEDTQRISRDGATSTPVSRGVYNKPVHEHSEADNKAVP